MSSSTMAIVGARVLYENTASGRSAGNMKPVGRNAVLAGGHKGSFSLLGGHKAAPIDSCGGCDCCSPLVGMVVNLDLSGGAVTIGGKPV
jgi:hypothetical protein